MSTFNDDLLKKGTDSLYAKQEENLLQISANNMGMLYVDLTAIPISTDALALIPEETSHETDVVAFKLIGDELHVGVHSPKSQKSQGILEELKKNYTLILYLVSRASLRKAWDRYDDLKMASKSKSFLDISSESIAEIAQNISAIRDVRPLLLNIEENPVNKVSRMIEVIMASAIALGSSDVHIEPQDDRVRLRFRLDGVLQDVAFFDEKVFKLIKSRIKILSGMKITIDKDAQDGRFTIEYDNVDIEIRTSTIPSAYGEGIVMRILDPKGISVGFDSLGIEKNLLEILKKEISKPNGMILTTGPTGSGKTTTLYSFMKHVYNPEIKILTIEDPIEYHLTGINQTQVNKEEGYDFISGLRAALRQDPDVIMVGEIRDGETASIAVNASLTGHIVFSTLHTNNAAGVIPRLLDLGVNPGVLASALTVSIAQRLARKICPHCKISRKPNPSERKVIDAVLAQGQNNNKPIDIYYSGGEYEVSEGKGCPACNDTGYKGRIGLYEAILTDDTIEQLLYEEPNEYIIRKNSSHQGIFNMAEDGVIKVISGITSFEEINRVVNIDDYLDISLSLNKNNTIVEKKNNTESTTNYKSDVSTLIEKLDSLHKNQEENPEMDASNQIKEIKTLFSTILQNHTPEKVFIQKNNEKNLHQEMNEIEDKLNKLLEHQQEKSHISIGEDSKNIKRNTTTPP
jgi:type II secretory ATPase GspE/PulE/Tfp pilus assembly ATPase PilB-like protein